MKKVGLILILLAGCGMVQTNFDIDHEAHIPEIKAIISHYQSHRILKDLEETYLVRPGENLQLFEYEYDNEDITSEMHITYSYLLEVVSAPASARNLYEENIDLLEETFLGDQLKERLFNGLNYHAFRTNSLVPTCSKPL